jgi:hypothetical protein
MLLLATSTEMWSSVFWDTIHVDLFINTILEELAAFIFMVVYCHWTTHLMAATGSTRMSVPAHLSTHTHTFVMCCIIMLVLILKLSWPKAIFKQSHIHIKFLLGVVSVVLEILF